jgi:hypothetical protein
MSYIILLEKRENPCPQGCLEQARPLTDIGRWIGSTGHAEIMTSQQWCVFQRCFIDVVIFTVASKQ